MEYADENSILRYMAQQQAECASGAFEILTNRLAYANINTVS